MSRAPIDVQPYWFGSNAIAGAQFTRDEALLKANASQLSVKAAGERRKTLDSSFRWNDDLKDIALNTVVPAQAGTHGPPSHCRLQL